MNKTLINTKVNKKRQSKAVIHFNQFMSVIWINNTNVFFSVIFGAFNGVFIKPSIYFVVYFWLWQLRSSILSNLMLFCLFLYMVLGPGRIPQFEMVSWALWWTGATMRKRKGNVMPQRDWKEGCAAVIISIKRASRHSVAHGSCPTFPSQSGLATFFISEEVSFNITLSVKLGGRGQASFNVQVSCTAFSGYSNTLSNQSANVFSLCLVQTSQNS